ncbi:MAG TPA: Ldh family oxidoreductase [Chloroflexota bacterium]|nr:Ldh family oxidoreductase [Chloroflexota bacterium]
MPEEMYRRVDAARLERLVTGIFRHAGLREEHAAFMGQCLVDADLRGVHSHGTRWAPVYARGLRAGSLNPRAEPRLVHDRGATAIMDGDRGVGHIAVKAAMDVAVAKAREFGNATVAIRRNGHCGAMAYYTQQAADAGCIGFAATTGGTMIAPWGGLERRVGLNPISWAAPSGRGFAFNLDMAPSVVAGSKIQMAQARKEKIPLDWALDAEGNPTDDPEQAFREGTLAPIGGPKGVGLGIAADILCAVLSGGRYGEASGEQGQRERGGGQIVQAIDIEHFQPLAEFTARMDRMIDYLKSARPKPGAGGIFVPGELEYQRRQEALRSGIPLDQPTRDLLRQEAETCALPYDLE